MALKAGYEGIKRNLIGKDGKPIGTGGGNKFIGDLQGISKADFETLFPTINVGDYFELFERTFLIVQKTDTHKAIHGYGPAGQLCRLYVSGDYVATAYDNLHVDKYANINAVLWENDVATYAPSDISVGMALRNTTIGSTSSLVYGMVSLGTVVLNCRMYLPSATGSITLYDIVITADGDHQVLTRTAVE